jgi:tetratricopeptide (TPR) repeat protein
VVAPLALLGICLTWPRRSSLWLLYLMLAAFAASVVMFYVFARYRYPLVPFLVLFASAGLAAFRSALRSGPLPRTAGCIAATIAAFVFCNWPMTSKRMMQATTFANIGNAYVLRGKPDKAIAYYRQSLEIEPSLETRCWLASALDACGDLDEAITYYRRALQMAPDYADAMNNLGNALVKQGKLDEAIGQYRQALRIDPRLVTAMNNLGGALQRQGKLDEAAGCYRQALQVDPDNTDVRRNLAAVLASQGKLDEAIREYRQVLKVDPGLPLDHVGLASALSMTGEMEEAFRHLREAVRLAPDSPVVLNQVAWLLATQPGWDREARNEAIRLARQSSELTGNKNAGILDTLAAAFAAAGQFDQALATAQMALERASAAGDERLTSDIRVRIGLYRQEKPYREPMPGPVATRPLFVQ